MAAKQLIINTNVVGPEKVIENQAVVLEEGRIAHILPMAKLEFSIPTYQEMEIHQGEGFYLVPGFIDMHSDNIEWLIQPRPQSLIDFSIALMEHEKQLINQGITQMFHSLSFLPPGTPTTVVKKAREPENMKRIASLIKEMHRNEHLIRHRFHCRYDIRNIEGYETLLEYLEANFISLLSFTDHTPGQGQYRDLIRYRDILKGYHPQSTMAEIDDMIAKKMDKEKLPLKVLSETAKLAHDKGIKIASHDDDSLDKLNMVTSEFKANISEFPVSLEVARGAKERGMYTVAGAPNVLMGYSHSGNLSATEGILDGSIDILCSDYYPASLNHAVFKLHREQGLDLSQCINLVSLNPAKALGLGEDYGSIEEGKIGDLLLIDVIHGRPYVKKVFINGSLVSQLNYRRLDYAEGQ